MPTTTDTTVEMKVCTMCKRELPATPEFFNKNGGKKAPRFRARCRDCRVEERKIRKAQKAAAEAKKEKELEETDLRKEAQPKFEVDASSRSDINRRAILRLIEKHRSEFEFYVFQEENNARLRARREKYPPRKRWVSLGQAMTEDEDRDVLPEFALV